MHQVTPNLPTILATEPGWGLGSPLPGRRRGEYLGDVGVDGVLAGRRGDGDAVMPVRHDVQVADPVDVDRRDRLAAPLGQREALPARSWAAGRASKLRMGLADTDGASGHRAD